MLPTFHIASLNRYTPNFSGVTQKLTWCQQFGLQVLPKWGNANILLLKKAVFRCFFGLNKFFRPNVWLSPIAYHTYLESYDTQLWFGLSGNHFSASYKAPDFCWQNRLNFLEHLTMSPIQFSLCWSMLKCTKKNRGLYDAAIYQDSHFWECHIFSSKGTISPIVS